MELDDLLIECIDALRMTIWDSDDRNEHLKRITEAVAKDSTPEDLRELLRSAAALFQDHQRAGLIQLISEGDSRADELATSIQARMTDTAPQFVYHGTIHGRLGDILKDGLLPGKVPVWKDQHVPRAFTDSAVFFSMTWRGAMLWAESAHYRTRGRRNGPHRTLAVIRLPASGLALEPDTVANRPGCLMVRGSVPVNEAQVILGRVQGFPKWRPLTDVLNSTRR